MPRYAVPFELYGVIEVEADSPDTAQEMAVEGIGIGEMDLNGEWSYWQIDGNTVMKAEEI